MISPTRATVDVRPSPLRHAWWWALDYLYAGVRQLAIWAPPWGFGRHRPTPHGWAEGNAGLPEIVLLPGVYEHWSFLRPLGDALSAAGYRVSVVHGLRANRDDIADTSDKLGRAFARSRPRAAGRVIVAHSKGGLIGKHLLVASGAAAAAAAEAADGGDPTAAAASAPAPGEPETVSAPLGVLGMVAVCTPFHGSTLARLIWGDRSIRAFLPTDETIVSLGRESSVNGRIVSVFGTYDPHIPDGSMLDGATNVQVPAVGHFRVLASPHTYRAVIDGIALLSAPSMADQLDA